MTLATAARAQRAAAVSQPASHPTRIATTVYGSDVVRVARGFLGVRYVWGGTTPDAFDCSGFVRYVFDHFGIALPRTAHEQAAFGTAPDVGDLRAGDLLFFWGGDGAQHIAIYVAGDTVIHASSGHGKVSYGFLHRDGRRKTWLGERLIAVRRVLPASGFVAIPGAQATTLTPAPTRVAHGSTGGQ